MIVELSAGEARRIALAAQGLADPRPTAEPGVRQLTATIDRIGLLQIDSVNVLSRAHYLPLFSRLGAYPRGLLDEMAWGRRRRLLEYWAHEASLLPPATHLLLRWRMADAERGVGAWKGIARFLDEHPQLVERALEEIRARGPLAASDFDWGSRRREKWWGWNEPKRALEALFWTGRLTTAGRRASFERVYGLPEQVLPKAAAQAPVPPREEAQRALLRIAARAMGIATERDLRDYFRMGVAETRARLAELVEAGELVPVRVKGWREAAYLHPKARRPRKARASALLSPFDNLIWFRERTERLFGLRYRIEIYTPAEKRAHGYYVLPFLQGESITARVDLKADRKAGVLLVQHAHAEPAATAQTSHALAAELSLMSAWLGLDAVRVAPRGDLAERLAAALPQASRQAGAGQRDDG